MRTRSRQLTRTIAILASALSLAGCGRELATAPKASANVILTGAALVVEGSSFSLLGFDHGFRGEIPYRFTNVSDQPVSLLNCLGGYGVWLERKEGAAWQTGYAGIRLGCLSPPIVIAPGEQLADTLRFDEYPFILLTLALSLQAAYAAPLILLAQNRQEARDRVIAEQDRQADARAHADMEFLAREVASLRMSVGEVATRDYLRSELRTLLSDLDERAESRAGSHHDGDDDPRPDTH